MKRYRLIISGRVQGVGFRYHASMLASKYKLTGFAKNLSDGNVLVEAQGQEESLALFKKELHQGNRFIKISSIKEEEVGIVIKEERFKVVY